MAGRAWALGAVPVALGRPDRFWYNPAGLRDPRNSTHHAIRVKFSVGECRIGKKDDRTSCEHRFEQGKARMPLVRQIMAYLALGALLVGSASPAHCQCAGHCRTSPSTVASVVSGDQRVSPRPAPSCCHKTRPPSRGNPSPTGTTCHSSGARCECHCGFRCECQNGSSDLATSGDSELQLSHGPTDHRTTECLTAEGSSVTGAFPAFGEHRACSSAQLCATLGRFTL